MARRNVPVWRRVLPSAILSAGVVLGSCGAAAWAGAAAREVGGLSDLYAWPEDKTNLVVNPSFETIGDDGQPDGWVNSAPESLSVTDATAHSGRRSVRLQDGHPSGKAPFLHSPVPLAPGWYSMHGWVKTEGVESKRRGGGGRVSVWRENRGAASPAARGTTGWKRIGRPIFHVGPGESPSVRLEAYRQPTGRVFFDDIAVQRLVPPVLEGFLRAPNYRGLLFDDRPQVIEMAVAVRPEEAKARLSDLKVRLLLMREGESEVVTSAEVTPTAPTFIMTLDARSVAPGPYLLRLQAVLREARTQLIFEYPHYRIVKMAARARQDLRTYVDPDNVLVLNGERRFAFGIYDTTGYSNRAEAYAGRIAKIAEAPFNLYINYWQGRAPDSALNALMAALQKHGLFYLHTVNTWYADHPRWPAATPCGARSARELGQEGFTACRATSLGSAPGLAGWYTADERPADDVVHVFQQYKILRQHDPDGITFIAQNRLKELPWWRDAADVIDAHRYPIFNIPEGAVAPLELVLQTTDAAVEAVQGSRPVWTVLQFFRFGARGHWPTLAELRTMSYMAIVAGAKGLFYWSYGTKGLSWVKDERLREELWQRLVTVTREIKALEPALLSPSAPQVLKAHAVGDGIRFLAKRVNGARYIIAVNGSAREQTATFTLAERAQLVAVIGEERTLTLTADRTFEDRFTPYATHVYEIRKPKTDY